MRRPKIRITCKETVELLSDYLSEPVSRRVRVVLRIHLKGCPGCRAYERQLVEIIRACQAMIAEEPSQAQMSRLLEVFTASGAALRNNQRTVPGET